ncbi:hypothetical protein V2W45_209218 [Cenococcum geophilum]
MCLSTFTCQYHRINFSTKKMNDKSVCSIASMRSAEDLPATTALFTAYAESLDIDLTFQNFQSEIASIPWKHAYSKCELLLARNSEGSLRVTWLSAI